MRVLYITGGCLTKNTSANMSHNAFIRGLLDCAAEIDILMANDSWGAEDKALPRFENVNYYKYNKKSTGDKIREIFHGNKGSRKNCEQNFVTTEPMDIPKRTLRFRIRNVAKKVYYSVFPNDPVYPLDKEWIKNASSFKSDIPYDLVISNSSPAASHKLASILIEKKHIRCKRWIQIWEDPWYHDLYGGLSDKVQEEERKLLCNAQSIYYVSPITLMYQKTYYPEAAHKMNWVPLPFFDFSDLQSSEVEPNSIGYFGDYYSSARNIIPFYDALKETGLSGYIYGDSDVILPPTEKIDVHGRVTLDALKEVQAKSKVLVHLSNLKGGQIPGKIYHYSATDKPILFILDGAEEEKKILKEYFGKYDRYYFCENTGADIMITINRIISERKTFSVVTEFSPKYVVGMILK